MRLEYALLILGMAIVAYVPRALPAVFIEKMKFGRKFKKFLELIPYTAMAAMIIPGVITVDPTKIYIGLAGGGIAALLAYFKAPVMVCLISAIVTDMVLYVII